MANTVPKRGATIDLGRLLAQLATPLTEVNSTESGNVGVLHIEARGKMVKMLCAPYTDAQDPLNFLEALETDMTLRDAHLAAGADCVCLVVMAKFINNPKTVLAIYGKV